MCYLCTRFVPCRCLTRACSRQGVRRPGSVRDADDCLAADAQSVSLLNMLEIVLDKSYLDGASTASVIGLCDRYSVLMPQELFFELMTTSAKSQRRCFSKLPDRDAPVALVPPVG